MKRTINGSLTSKDPVGFCSYWKHPGCVTENQLEQHNCDLKHCRHFKRYRDNTYWKKTKRIEKRKVDWNKRNKIHY